MRTEKLRPILRTVGFSLAEVLIVISIIGILASIAIPIILDQKDKAIVGATKANLDTMRLALTQYTIYRTDNRYPTGQLGYPGFRTTVPEANLPPLETDARIVGGSFLYSSDGITYAIQAISANKSATPFIASPAGIVIE